ncbi:MAG: metal ABC transporter permease [Phycisphaeraceae bacterium]|nr:metal ABC transporter permease [Phycisphaeraceae bacterium]
MIHASLGAITDVAIEWPSLADIVRTLTLRAGYNTTVVIVGAALLGLAGGIVGTFALFRRRALVADALSHAALPGIALAFMVGVALAGHGRSTPLLLAGAAAGGIAGLLAIHAIARWTRLGEDAAIGIVLSVFFGFGTVLLGLIQGMSTGKEGGLKTFIYGQTAAMQASDAANIGAIAIASIILVSLLLKEFRLLCFDETFARAQGWPTNTLDYLILAMVLVVLVVGLQAVGLLLVVAILIIPPAAARFWSDRLDRLLWIAGGIGLAGGYFGAAASSLLPRMPAGAVIVLTSGLFFLVSMAFAPRRGLLAAAARRFVLRFRITRDHVLRAMLELKELVEPSIAADPHAVIRHAGASPLSGRLAILLARSQGLISRSTDGITLTPRGLENALRVVRNHRLWEQYLMHYAEIAPSHVDWSADLVEHVLDPSLIADLEKALSDDAERSGLPPSAHPLTARGRP